MNARGTYTVKTWEETEYQSLAPGKKLTRASVEYAFQGEIEGKGLVHYLMFYSRFDPKDPHASSASYVGLIHFEGRLAGKEGSFVLEDHGAFEGGAARSTLLIANGSGSGQLSGIRGTGSYLADREGFRIELEYEVG